MKILIAEDEQILANVLKDELDEVGFETFIAANGLKALKVMKTKSTRPNLLLLDILMPVMDGFQVLEEMKKDSVDNLSEIPVIVLSNLGQDDEIKKAIQLGAADYFVKSQHPISEVVEKVQGFLEKSGSVASKKIKKK